MSLVRHMSSDDDIVGLNASQLKRLSEQLPGVTEDRIMKVHATCLKERNAELQTSAALMYTQQNGSMTRSQQRAIEGTSQGKCRSTISAATTDAQRHKKNVPLSSLTHSAMSALDDDEEGTSSRIPFTASSPRSVQQRRRHKKHSQQRSSPSSRMRRKG